MLISLPPSDGEHYCTFLSLGFFIDMMGIIKSASWLCSEDLMSVSKSVHHVLVIVTV